MKNRILALAVLLLVGCATSSTKLNTVSLGMTKQQVIEAMGQPQSTRATSGSEYMIYRLTDASPLLFVVGHYLEREADYYVRLAGGRVDAYGKVGDFDSTHPQKYDVNIDMKGSTPQSPPAQPSAYDQACRDGVRAVENKDYTAAAEFFQRATVLDRSSAQAWGGLGLAQTSLHDYANALYSFKQALELSPNDQGKPALLAGLAGTYGMLDETNKYAETLEMVRRLDPAMAEGVVKAVREEKAKK